MFRAARAAGKLQTSGKPRKPETFEVGQAEQLLAGVYLLLQQLVHNHAEKGKKRPKKFRGAPWPSVRSAMDALVEEDRARVAEANRAFLDLLEFVPQAEWEAEVAEHVKALEAGAEMSPPQLRALEEAAAEPSPSVTRGGLGVPQAPLFSDPS